MNLPILKTCLFVTLQQKLFLRVGAMKNAHIAVYSIYIYSVVSSCDTQWHMYYKRNTVTIAKDMKLPWMIC